MRSRFHQEDTSLLDGFYVIAVISNPVRFESRYDLYLDFKKHMEESGVKLFTVELQQGERAHQVTEAGNPMHLQLRTYDELWHKENMINLALSRLPSDWRAVAWIDADIEFTNKNWAIETMQQLQHHHVVQLFSHAIDLGPKGETLQMHNGFMWSYLEGKQWYREPYAAFWHCGYAWAATREALDQVGGLIDKAILGSADHHMATALIGRAAESIAKVETSYTRYVMRWQERALRYLKKDVGYVNGTIIHKFHGKKANRKYVERWKILQDAKFNPEEDLYRDTQGIYVLNDNNIVLRDGIRAYFRARNEDDKSL